MFAALILIMLGYLYAAVAEGLILLLSGAFFGAWGPFVYALLRQVHSLAPSQWELF